MLLVDRQRAMELMNQACADFAQAAAEGDFETAAWAAGLAVAVRDYICHAWPAKAA